PIHYCSPSLLLTLQHTSLHDAHADGDEKIHNSRENAEEERAVSRSSFDRLAGGDSFAKKYFQVDLTQLWRMNRCISRSKILLSKTKTHSGNLRNALPGDVRSVEHVIFLVPQRTARFSRQGHVLGVFVTRNNETLPVQYLPIRAEFSDWWGENFMVLKSSRKQINICYKLMLDMHVHTKEEEEEEEEEEEVRNNRRFSSTASLTY
ncbi:unnamed protein product, partial [Heterotrigona itama]